MRVCPIGHTHCGPNVILINQRTTIAAMASCFISASLCSTPETECISTIKILGEFLLVQMDRGAPGQSQWNIFMIYAKCLRKISDGNSDFNACTCLQAARESAQFSAPLHAQQHEEIMVDSGMRLAKTPPSDGLIAVMVDKQLLVSAHRGHKFCIVE